jgi:hypothetical protein
METIINQVRDLVSNLSGNYLGEVKITVEVPTESFGTIQERIHEAVKNHQSLNLSNPITPFKKDIRFFFPPNTQLVVKIKE